MKALLALCLAALAIAPAASALFQFAGPRPPLPTPENHTLQPIVSQSSCGPSLLDPNGGCVTFSSTYMNLGFENLTQGPLGVTKALPSWLANVAYSTVLTRPPKVWINVTNAAAHGGSQALSYTDRASGSYGTAYLQLNVTPYSVLPNYTVSFWFRQVGRSGNAQSVVTLAAAATTTGPAASTIIGLVLFTGGTRTSMDCGTMAICFYNRTPAGYTKLASYVNDTWYEVSAHVFNDTRAGATYLNWFVNGTLASANARVMQPLNGNVGQLASLYVWSNGASPVTFYLDDISVTGGPSVVPSSTYSMERKTGRFGSDHTISFDDLRRVHRATNLTLAPWMGASDWTVWSKGMLQPSIGPRQDNRSAAQGLVYSFGGKYYYFYSMHCNFGPECPTTARAIGLALSSDGKSWTRYAGNGGARSAVVMWPAATPGDCSYYSYAPAYITHRQGVFWMLYSGTQVPDRERTRYLTCLATSTNLTWWTPRPDLTGYGHSGAVLKPTTGDCAGDATLSSVTWDPTIGRYVAAVGCKVSEFSAVRTIHWAVSNGTNLIDWTMNPSPRGRIVPDSSYHGAVLWYAHGLLYALLARFLNPPQSLLEPGHLLVSDDGVGWHTLQGGGYLRAELVPGSSCTGAVTTSPIYDHPTVALDALGGPLLLNGNVVFGMRCHYANTTHGEDLWTRPQHRFAGFQVAPGYAAGDFLTQPVEAPFALGHLSMDLAGSPSGTASVAILSGTGDMLQGFSDKITASGTHIPVTWGGKPDLNLSSPDGHFAFLVRLERSGDSPTIFALSVGAVAALVGAGLPVVGASLSPLSAHQNETLSFRLTIDNNHPRSGLSLLSAFVRFCWQSFADGFYFKPDDGTIVTMAPAFVASHTATFARTVSVDARTRDSCAWTAEITRMAPDGLMPETTVVQGNLTVSAPPSPSFPPAFPSPLGPPPLIGLWVLMPAVAATGWSAVLVFWLWRKAKRGNQDDPRFRTAVKVRVPHSD